MSGKGPGSRLDITRWGIAYDHRALAEVACDVWSYTAAMAHKQICLQIALEASSEGRSYQIAIHYDQMCRSKWKEQALRGDFGKDALQELAETRHNEILEQARRKCDFLKKEAEAERNKSATRGQAQGAQQQNGTAQRNQNYGYNGAKGKGRHDQWQYQQPKGQPKGAGKQKSGKEHESNKRRKVEAAENHDVGSVQQELKALREMLGK